MRIFESESQCTKAPGHAPLFGLRRAHAKSRPKNSTLHPRRTQRVGPARRGFDAGHCGRSPTCVLSCRDPAVKPAPRSALIGGFLLPSSAVRSQKATHWARCGDGYILDNFISPHIPCRLKSDHRHWNSERVRSRSLFRRVATSLKTRAKSL